LEQLYIGREFQGEKAFSRMMSTLFVILSYSSGMPVLYVVGVIFYTITFFVSKLLILKFYRKSTNLSKTIPVISTNAMKLGIILHILFGCVMLTNPQPFTTL
jgi:cytochrome b subunit of formate dehydrogenase